MKETLTQLILSSNCIENVPSGISLCKHLQFIDLGKNCLLDLPFELGDLKNLRELVISNNKYVQSFCNFMFDDVCMCDTRKKNTDNNNKII